MPEPNEDIDYLHPDGKPETAEPATDEDDTQSLKQQRQALDEADGHYMPARDPYIDKLKKENQSEDER